MINNVLEISKRANKGGRVSIKIALLKIHEVLEETNKNGLHWELEYVKNAMDSASMMPICAEFCDEDKSTPLGHGLTETIVTDDGIKEPLFQNSETVGVIETVGIEEVSDEDGNIIKVLCGTGYLFNQRYPNFVKWVRTNYAVNKVDSSIEIMGTSDNNNQIVYLEEEPTSDYRTPTEFVFSGTAILSLTPADNNAIVLEVAQKSSQKEGNNNMEFDMKEIKTAIQDTISELSNREKSFESKISELNNELAQKDEIIKEKETCIEEKDSEISTLTASVDQVKKALADLETERDSYWAERDALQKELGKLKAEKRIAEMNEKIQEFTEDERKFADSEINSFKENPVDGDIDSIISKIYVGIGQKTKQAKITEINTKKEEKVDVADIFSEMCSGTHKEEDSDEDVNIF